MKLVIQRVTHASVTVDNNVIGKIGKGYMVLIGVSDTDTKEIADKMLDKMIKLRIFEDENGKTNLSLADVGGELLLISQFTLYANCKKGNRPSFIEAGSPDHANALYEYIKARGCGGTGRIRRRNEGRAAERRSIYRNSGFPADLRVENGRIHRIFKKFRK